MNRGYKQYAKTSAQVKKKKKKSGVDITNDFLRDLKQKNQKKQPIRWEKKPILFFTVGFILSLFLWLYLEEIERFADRIEIGAFSTSLAAEDQEKKPQTKGGAKAKNAQDPTKANKGKKPSGSENRLEKLSYLKKLKDKKKELDLREDELLRLERELQKQREEIGKKISELEGVREQIANMLKDRVKLDNDRIDKLVQVYTNMKAPQAAKVIEKIQEDLAIEILGRMKKKSAADILNLLPAKKAQVLSEKFTGYRKI